MVQAVEAAVPTSLPFVLDQSLDMRLIFNWLPPVPRARVLGDQLDPVENAHALQARDNGHRSPRDRRRDRVVVQVETDVRRLTDVRFDALVADERMLGQTE